MQEFKNQGHSCPLAAFCQWKEWRKKDNCPLFFQKAFAAACGIESILTILLQFFQAGLNILGDAEWCYVSYSTDHSANFKLADRELWLIVLHSLETSPFIPGSCTEAGLKWGQLMMATTLKDSTDTVHHDFTGMYNSGATDTKQPLFVWSDKAKGWLCDLYMKLNVCYTWALCVCLCVLDLQTTGCLWDLMKSNCVLLSSFSEGLSLPSWTSALSVPLFLSHRLWPEHRNKIQSCCVAVSFTVTTACFQNNM